MIRHAVALAFVLGLAVPLSAGDAESLDESEWYPLAVGTTWTFENQITVRVAAHEKVGSVLCARLDTSTNGGAIASEHISVDATGVYRHRYNGVAIEPPLCITKLPYESGSEWAIDSRQAGLHLEGKFHAGPEEKLSTPAGDFTVITSSGDFTVSGMSLSVKYHFAKERGPVKIELTLDGQETILALSSYEAGEKTKKSEPKAKEKPGARRWF